MVLWPNFGHSTIDRILALAPDFRTWARILAASKPESGSWLHAFPMSSIALCMDDQTICIACLGFKPKLSSLPSSHLIVSSAGQTLIILVFMASVVKRVRAPSRHTGLSEPLKRLLMSMGTLVHLEPLRLCKSYRKRPDGNTFIEQRASVNLGRHLFRYFCSTSWYPGSQRCRPDPYSSLREEEEQVF